MEVLSTIDMDWETIPQYMDKLDKTLGVNTGTLIGHTPVRHYVMGDECQKRAATEEEIKAHAGRRARWLDGGCAWLVAVAPERSFRSAGRSDSRALWADENEIFALADVLRELSTGTIQVGGGVDQELKDGMMARLAEATGRTVVYNNLSQTVRNPDKWKTHMARVDETVAKGIKAYPMCSPNRVTQDFTMRNCQVFRGLPTWHPILHLVGRRKVRAYSDPGRSPEAA